MPLKIISKKGDNCIFDNNYKKKIKIDPLTKYF